MLRQLARRIHLRTGLYQADILEAIDRLCNGEGLDVPTPLDQVNLGAYSVPATPSINFGPYYAPASSLGREYDIGRPRRDLCHVLKQLPALDRDGTTDRLWRWLWNSWPLFREVYSKGMGHTAKGNPANKPLSEQRILGNPGDRDSGTSTGTSSAPAEPARDVSEAPVHPDGPEPPRHLRWNGVHRRLAPRHYQILTCLWGRDSVPVEELVDHVWDREGEEEIKEGTIRSALAKLNNKLAEIGVPFHYYLRDGMIVKE
jgi:hypothetical protein